MKLITKEIERKLLNPDGRPHLKLFTPFGACTWLISEAYEDEPGLYFGLADLGFGYPELGDIYLPELTAATTIERDRWFKPTKSLKEYADEAREEGRIYA